MSFILFAVIAMLSNSNVYGDDNKVYEDFYHSLAYHWAPIIYHDVGVSYGERGLEDIPMKLNFDNDWKGCNNWENLTIKNQSNKGYDYKAYTYYSVVETESDYYIIYSLFHPRDEANQAGSIDKHENDIESIILNIKKNNSDKGVFNAMITQSHGWWNYYKKEELSFHKNKPKVWVDSGGHAIYNYNGESARGLKKDGVIFVPVNNFSSRESNSFFHSMILKGKQNQIGNFKQSFEYELLSLNDIYLKNLNDFINGNREMFINFGILNGDTHGKNKARFLWGNQESKKYFSSYAWEDPVVFFNNGFKDMFKNVSHNYVKNNNYNYIIEFDDIIYTGGKKDSIYLDIYIGDNKIVNNYVWGKNNVNNEEKIKINLFGDDNRKGFTIPTNKLLLSIPYSKGDLITDVHIIIRRKGGTLTHKIDYLKFENIENISTKFKYYDTINEKCKIKLKLQKNSM
ncbi:hypothetical protein [Oceanirhabdus sp. W0125-5]|uniref:hypothetical protein n=1 Tax=Oceanirhabdus sp. W0125-5 TaxID=2999116 RepID=UPI0022F30AC9|nr:hypothetical protein [Oceanirhabdus sp. W0125-5]WBW94756.1 hypothetical protein OW730_13730 [Oceanirhabdus sp. W0125-5]